MQHWIPELLSTNATISKKITKHKRDRVGVYHAITAQAERHQDWSQMLKHRMDDLDILTTRQ
jgi:hypothetical protein